MAVVHFVRKVPTADGTLVAAQGSLRFIPTAKRFITGTPDATILPVGFQVQLVNGVADVTLAPTTGAWVWRLEEWIDGLSKVTTYVAVPDVAEVDDATLTVVDPATLLPTAAPEPAWVAMARSTVTTGAVTGDALILTRTDGTTVNAGNVRGAAGSDATVTPESVATNLPARLSDASLEAKYSLTLVHNGTAYPARPAGAPAGHVTYIGPTQPTTWLPNDQWVNNA